MTREDIVHLGRAVESLSTMAADLPGVISAGYARYESSKAAVHLGSRQFVPLFGRQPDARDIDEGRAWRHAVTVDGVEFFCILEAGE
jgi:hypothetical protein